ncbi:MAG: GH3 auxin-responsive promoter family protein [Bacteroidota bacterium]
MSRIVDRERRTAREDQRRIFGELISRGRQTAFGRDHGYADIRSQQDFVNQVPIRDYEGLRHYFERITEGETDVLWPDKPKYLAKTSGTTSGVKYIPITPDSLPNHLNTARKALLNYASEGGRSRVFGGKVMFVSGSPVMTKTGGIDTGRLSGIVNHEIPAWIKGNQLPSFQTNCIDDWEVKVDQIVNETKHSDLRLISGIPPWVQMYFERLLAATGRDSVIEVFPNLQVFMYGGVNYEPYRGAIEDLIGTSIDSVELYPASEGFIAYQDSYQNEGLLLNTNSGIFFEFIPVAEVHHTNPTRLSIDEIELGQDYAVIINSNAGLWGYNLGDLVRFVSMEPYRIVVSGRVKHYISAFGEHVIGKEVEEAILRAAMDHGVRIREFTVAPQVNPEQEQRPYHEWLVEWEREPESISAFASTVDYHLREQNIYYNDLITGQILQPLQIRTMRANAFRDYMASQGKLGGQNKVPRLSNDRRLAEALLSV